jgi:hypothetical protein
VDVAVVHQLPADGADVYVLLPARANWRSPTATRPPALSARHAKQQGATPLPRRRFASSPHRVAWPQRASALDEYEWSTRAAALHGTHSRRRPVSINRSERPGASPPSAWRHHSSTASATPSRVMAVVSMRTILQVRSARRPSASRPNCRRRVRASCEGDRRRARLPRRGRRRAAGVVLHVVAGVPCARPIRSRTASTPWSGWQACRRRVSTRRIPPRATVRADGAAAVTTLRIRPRASRR